MSKEQESARTAADDQADDQFYIIGIGASAGGLEALESFFDNVPENPGSAFVVIQHLSPDYKSLMAELLTKHTRLSIRQVEDGIVVRPNTIYLIPRRTNMTIFNGRLFLTEQEHGLNLPIDIFFRSLADDQGDRAIGIVLSGTGSDGTRGIRAIKEAGGMVMVQEEESAKFNGMPRSAIATGIVDYILPVHEMPAALAKYTSGNISLLNSIGHVERDPNEHVTPNALARVFLLIKRKTGVDLSFYKESTILRRIERRMAINQTTDLPGYVQFLEDYPNEVTTLYKEILIGVTKFFRDTEAFDILQQRVIPEIFNSRTMDEPVRIWVSGCSTGEEAYSIAILFAEYLEAHDLTTEVKIFATDIDKDAIEFASTGTYPESIAADATIIRLRKYFIRKGDSYQIVPAIREMVVFAYHNIFKDPPFRSIDLLSCRNLMIYLQPILQRKVLSNFQFSLLNSGFLFLGSSETVGDSAKFFNSFDVKWKIYRYQGGAERRTQVRIPLRPSVPEPERRPGPPAAQGTRLHLQMEPRVSDNVYERIIDGFLAPSVLINEDREVLHIFGDVSPFLRLPGGKMNLDVLKMAEEDSAIPLGTAIQTASRSGSPVIYDDVIVKTRNGARAIRLSVHPVAAAFQTRYLLVKFDLLDDSAQPNIERYNMEESVRHRIRDLEGELQHTRENLQATIEELETSNEELQATNEELLSSNEELQSTNEELQSVNEELITVNSEYQKKIEELSELNDDMNNLLSGSDVGTIFLDADITIRKYTPPIAEYFKIIKSDVGRPLSDLAHDLIHDSLLDDVREVLRTLEPKQVEVATKTDRWVLLKIHPYRSIQQNTSGIVLTLIDITQRRRAEQALRRKHELLMRILESNPTAITMVDADGNLVFANRRAGELLGLGDTSPAGLRFDARQFGITDLEGNPVNSDDLPFSQIVRTKRPIDRYVHVVHRPDGSSVALSITGNPILDERGEVEGAVFDMVEHREVSR